MGKSKGGLGRDFYSLLDDNSFESKGPVTKLALKDIQARRDQPRKDFDMNALQLLADSIREHGVIQPILVREIEFTPGKYEIVAGERRFRAAEMAGIDEIPVSIMTGDDLEVAKVALIENVQRRDLNPIEEAMAYRVLMDRFGRAKTVRPWRICCACWICRSRFWKWCGTEAFRQGTRAPC